MTTRTRSESATARCFGARRSCSCARRERRPRRVRVASRAPRLRGLSILELLLALGLLVLAAGIAWPALDRAASERSFDAALDSIDARLRQARARAMRSGRAIEVVLERDGDGTGAADPEDAVTWFRARYADGAPEALDAGTGETNDRFAVGGPSSARRPASAGFGDDEDRAALVPATWAQQALPAGVRWFEPDPFALAAGAADAGDPEDLAVMEARFEDAARSFERRMADRSLGPDADEDRRVLALFLPDGSALAVRSAWIEDADGRTALITIAPASGIATVVRKDPYAETEFVEDEPDEDAADETADDDRDRVDDERTGSDRDARTRPDPSGDDAFTVDPDVAGDAGARGNDDDDDAGGAP